jgi:hypothetical protein
MKRMRALVGYLLLASWVCASTAAAQQAQQVVEDLNRDAMEAYNNLDIERAGSMLEEALRVAMEGGVQGPLLALTNLNLGIIYIGGLGDNDGGLRYFVAAICADPSSQLDPLTSTPDIQSVFGVAQQQAQGGGCPSGGGGGGSVVPSAGAVAAPMGEAVVHHSPPEQLSQSPLPLYVEVSRAAKPKKVQLYYKGLGMDSFKRVDMFNYKGGFAYQISCNDVWEPKVTYYIEAVASGGRVIGSAGTSAAPIEVPIVSMRTQGEPALPGAESPGTCKEEECPPGLAGCEKPGTFGIGEACERNKDCQSGLKCDDDACVLNGAGSTDASEGRDDSGDGGWGDPDDYDDDDEGSSDKGEFRRFFFNVGFNVGFAYVKPGMEADHGPPDNRVFVAEGPLDMNGQRASLGYADPNVPGLEPLNVHNGLDGMPGTADDGRIILPDSENYPQRQTAWVPDADSGDSLLNEVGAYQGDCAADGIETDPFLQDPNLLYPSKYCVRVKKPGFVPGMGLRMQVGYFLTEHFALAIPVRIQFGAGEGTLSSVLIGLRGEYQWLKPKATGFFFSNYLGFTVGQIQAQPPADNATDDAPWVISGPVGAHLGIYQLRYRFHPNVGLISSAELDIQFPNFLMNIDWTALGVETSF